MTYDVIYADPPWKYPGATPSGSQASIHYPTMSDAALVAMRDHVSSLCAQDAVLFMWVTFPRLEFGLELIRAWGFEYKTNAFTWLKTNKDGQNFSYGPGYYTSSNAELLFLATKGKCLRPDYKMLNSVVMSPREEHSKKPDVFRDKITQMYPTQRKIELFARTQPVGWDVWGNEALPPAQHRLFEEYQQQMGTEE